jgi:hypothetical protein
MSFVMPFRRMQPDVDTEQGTIENPFVPFLPTTYVQRTPPVMSDMRGRHQYREQPRPIGPGSIFMDGVQMADYTEGVVEYPDRPYPRHEGVTGYGYLPAYPGIQGDDGPMSKLGLIILLGVVGVIAYMIGKSSGAKKNPMSCRKGWAGRGRQHRAWVCSRCGGGRKCSHKRQALSVGGKNRRLSRLAKDRPRDDQGRFI